MEMLAGDVWKYGTTKQDEVIKTSGISGTARYGANELPTGLRSRLVFTGNKLQVAFMEKVYIAQYVLKHRDLPPGNKVFR